MDSERLEQLRKDVWSFCKTLSWEDYQTKRTMEEVLNLIENAKP